MISKIKELESYEMVILGICSSFALLMAVLIVLNTIKM